MVRTGNSQCVARRKSGRLDGTRARGVRYVCNGKTEEALEHPITDAVLENASLTSGDANSRLPLAYDAADRSLVARGAPPGTYSLQIATAPELADMLQQPLTVKVGEESRIDLRNQPLPPSARGAIRWVDLKLLEKAKPASGIQVGVYAERYPPELVDGWIKSHANAATNDMEAGVPTNRASAASSSRWIV